MPITYQSPQELHLEENLQTYNQQLANYLHSLTEDSTAIPIGFGSWREPGGSPQETYSTIPDV